MTRTEKSDPREPSPVPEELLFDVAVEAYRRLPWWVKTALLVAFVVGAVALVLLVVRP